MTNTGLFLGKGPSRSLLCLSKWCHAGKTAPHDAALCLTAAVSPPGRATGERDPHITWMHAGKRNMACKRNKEIRNEEQQRRDNQRQMKNKTELFHIKTPEGLEKHVCTKDILSIYLRWMSHLGDYNYTLMFCWHGNLPLCSVCAHPGHHLSVGPCQTETPNGAEEGFQRRAKIYIYCTGKHAGMGTNWQYLFNSSCN